MRPTWWREELKRPLQPTARVMRMHVMGCSPSYPNAGGAHSGYLVEGPGALLLDCGPGVLSRLRARGPLRVDAIAITHFHLDHWGDLVPWAWLRRYPPGERSPRPRLLLPPGGSALLELFASHWGSPGMFEEAFEVEEYEEGRSLPIAGFELEALRLPHGDRAYGFRIQAGGRTLAYSGDSGPGPELCLLAEGADLFLCEATLEAGEFDGHPRSHLAADEALAAADGPVLLTHRPSELPVPRGIRRAFDGLVVEI